MCTQGSREQLAIAEFAAALLVIPKTLAVNAAKDSTELVAKLRAYHNAAQSAPVGDARRGLRYYGLDLMKGEVRDNVKAGVLEPMVSKVKSLKSALEACTALLRIDDRVSTGGTASAYVSRTKLIFSPRRLRCLPSRRARTPTVTDWHSVYKVCLPPHRVGRALATRKITRLYPSRLPSAPLPCPCPQSRLRDRNLSRERLFGMSAPGNDSSLVCTAFLEALSTFPSSLRSLACSLALLLA